MSVADQHFDLIIGECGDRFDRIAAGACHTGKNHSVIRLQFGQRTEQAVGVLNRHLNVGLAQLVNQQLIPAAGVGRFDEQHAPLTTNVGVGGCRVVSGDRIIVGRIGNELRGVGVGRGFVDSVRQREDVFAGCQFDLLVQQQLFFTTDLSRHVQASDHRIDPFALDEVIDDDASFEGLAATDVGRQIDFFNQHIGVLSDRHGHHVDADPGLCQACDRRGRIARRLVSVADQNNTPPRIFRHDRLCQLQRRLQIGRVGASGQPVQAIGYGQVIGKWRHLNRGLGPKDD